MNRSERQHLAAVISDVRAWAGTAGQIHHLTEHMPLSGQVGLTRDEGPLLGDVNSAAYDTDRAEPLTKARLFGSNKKLQPAREAATRLMRFQPYAVGSNWPARLGQLRSRLAEQAERERRELHWIVAELDRGCDTASRALSDVAHMPMSRTGVLTPAEDTQLRSLTRLFELHAAAVAPLLEGGACAAGNCAELHSSARLLADLYREAMRDGAFQQINLAAERVTRQHEDERAELQRLAKQVSAWRKQVKTARTVRISARSAIETRASSMVERGVDVSLDGVPWRLLAVAPDDRELLQHLKLLRDQPLTPADEEKLDLATSVAGTFLPAVRAGYDARWACHRDGRCVDVHLAVTAAKVAALEVEPMLQRLGAPVAATLEELDGLLDPSLGFGTYLPSRPTAAEILNERTTKLAISRIGSVADAAKAARKAVAVAKSTAEDVRSSDVASALRAMDLETLKKASKDRIVTAPLAAAGLNDVYAVLQARDRLADLPRLGAASATSIIQAALRLFEGVREETPVRVDVKRRGKQTTDLLKALQAWDAARRFDPTEDEVTVAMAIAKLLRGSRTPPSRILAVTSSEAAGTAPTFVPLVSAALNRSAPPVERDVWTDFLSRPADYFGMLIELGFVTEDEKKMHGDLPEEIVEAVRAKELKRDRLSASLRAYQSFGARFALVQKKVIIGDEMGLGKTVEALAVLAHLRSMGQSHFLVVCPAAVVSNWMRETSKHTTLRSFRLHGPAWDRGYAAKAWVRSGGVAVTTYDLLPWAQIHLEQAELAAAIFDEAHYIKNPSAKRSLASQQVIETVEYAVLMTGTPLENSVQEFRNLIGYIRHDLADSAPEYLASKFRKHVAPAYLRRNQEDVLTELPDLVEVDEWMGLSTTDERDYRAAVSDGNFMKMRRAALLSDQSLKMSRLMEIVAEAEANDRRVIVFSYFRDVLGEVARRLPGNVFGPLTGSLPAAERQRVVDRFSSAGGGAALVAQITAGGVGLNIQSASVVVICEPQVKPTMEAQAIARAHRMGQVNTVQVHRLLTEDSVDERIQEILAEKRQLFDEFARDSVITAVAPDALDVNDAELARLVIAAERERLFGRESATVAAE